MTAPQFPPRMRLVKSRMRLAKAGTKEWQALERAATEKQAPTIPSRFRLVKAGTPEWLALEVPKTCPSCGQARIIEGPSYDRAAWRCHGCGAGPKSRKGKRPKA